MTLSDTTSNPGFKVYLQVEYLQKDSASLGQSYYRTLMGNHAHTQSSYRMVPLSLTLVTSNPDFKVTIFFVIEYLRNDTR